MMAGRISLPVCEALQQVARMPLGKGCNEELPLIACV